MNHRWKLLALLALSATQALHRRKDRIRIPAISEIRGVSVIFMTDPQGNGLIKLQG